MKLKPKNHERLLDKWEEWKYDIFWTSRHIYDRNELGDYQGKEFIKDQAILKLISKLLRKQWTLNK